MDDILDAADGIMIARGDLGVEVPIERIPSFRGPYETGQQKGQNRSSRHRRCSSPWTENRRPTRAEATDVSNAILDGTDWHMLSGESAMGKYPVDAVEMLQRSLLR